MNAGLNFLNTKNLSHIDSILATDSLNTDSLIEIKTTIIDSLTSKTELVHEIIKSELDSVKVKTEIVRIKYSNFSTGKEIDEYLRQVKVVYLGDSLELDSLPVDVLMNLEDIAYNCPIKYGEGVFLARAILLSISEYYWDDYELCDSVEINVRKKVQKNESENTILVMPNPFKSIFTVENSGQNKSLILSVEVFDLLGNVVLIKETKTHNLEIDMSGFTSGIYIVKVKTIDGLSLFKLIKE